MTRSLLVLPVRLTLAGQSVQTTTRSVTPEAIFIRSIAPPPVGLAVTLRLYLPDGPPEDLAGHVVPTPLGAERGCLVALACVTPAQRERIARATAPPMLQRRDSSPQLPALTWPGRGDSAPELAAVVRPAQHPGAADAGPTLTAFDLRALPRVPVQLKVRFDSVESLEDQLAINLSSGGMFVRCAEPAPLGTEVQLVIELPGLAPPLLCRAVVAHRVVQEQARTTGQVAGVGVQFLDSDDRFRELVDHHIAQVRAQGGRAH